VGDIKYKTLSNFNDNDILRLYENVGWVIYTEDIKKLIQAINNSLFVFTAWDKDKLVSLIRVVGDGESIIYIQDILVLREYQQNRVGAKLLKEVLEKYKDVRQKVVLTDDVEKTKSFYESNGFNFAKDLNLVSYVKIENN
jgi:ribosomal protein S18 acetylase RimI-like enzyme